MKDQWMLEAKGIPKPACDYSGMKLRRDRSDLDIVLWVIKFLYVSPSGLGFGSFYARFKADEYQLIAVDEAHLIYSGVRFSTLLTWRLRTTLIAFSSKIPDFGILTLICHAHSLAGIMARLEMISLHFFQQSFAREILLQRAIDEISLKD